MRRAWIWAVPALAAAAAAACDDGVANELRVPTAPAVDAAAPLEEIDAGEEPKEAGPRPKPPAKPTPIPTWTDEQAIKWLTDKCSSCHGVDPTTQQKAAYYSAWPIDPKGVSRAWLETSEYTPIAYQTILHRALDITAPPAAMPTAPPDDAGRIELKAMLDWFDRIIPYAVIDADARYGNTVSKTEQLIVNFTCEKPSSLRTFLSRFTFGALDRPPLPADAAAYTALELDGPVTREQREAIVGRLETDLKPEFLQKGLKKLASAVGGAPGIRSAPDLAADKVADLKEEFYQLLLAKYDTLDWDQVFGLNEVMASPKTATLYGCNVASGWASCPLVAPRGGFFTSVGFLASKQQSFLEESNNHGRTASVFFTLYGEGLLAATDGPSGGTIAPLPTCLDPSDMRAYQGAPRGSAAIATFGRVCQSCHISRHMAAGANLFRPFSKRGLVYQAGTFGQPSMPDYDLFTAAIDPKWTNNGAQVNGAVLTSLLTSPPKACTSTGTGAAYVNVNTVADLATQLTKNKSAVARGFMRHANRAFSNLPTITLELGLRGVQTFQGQHRMPDLVKAYFLSDTFSCEVNQ